MPYKLKRPQMHHDAPAGEALRVGEELREARLALGYSIAEVARLLRIRAAHLEALEEGRIRDLPAPAYAIGFVRTYARGLGLDADEMVRRFRELSGAAVNRKTPLIFPEPVPDRGVPAGAVIAVGALLVFGTYVAWFNWSGAGQRSVDVVPPVPSRLEQAAEQGRAQFPRELGAARPPAGNIPLATLPPPGGFQGAGSNTSAQAATVPAAPPPPPAPVAPAPVAAAPAQPPLIPMEGARILLRARDNNPEGAWVQVRDPRSGQVLLNRVLRPGETWPVPLRDGLLLDTGKAEGLDLVVEGQPTPALTNLVGVRRNIPLDAERLKAGPVAPNAQPRQAAAN